MKIKTGTIILGIITLIFGIDTLLSNNDAMTISEWFYNFLRNDPALGFTILVGSFGALIAHFWWFKSPEK